MPTPEPLLSHARAAAESSRTGPESSMARLAMKVATTFRRRVLVVAADLTADPPEVEVPLRVEVRRITATDIPAYCLLRPDEAAATVQARLDLGHHCFAIFCDATMVHAAWAATGRAYVPYLRRDLLLAPEDLYIYDSYTAPAYRGLGLAPLRHHHMRRHYRGLGLRRAVGVIAVENRAGLRVMDRLEFRRIGLYTCWRFGRWQRVRQETYADEPLPLLVRPA